MSPKVEIVIACEGQVTEPRYFQDCIDGYSAGLVRLRVLPVTGVPMTVVNAAISERDALLAAYRKNRSSYDACFRVWAVFDRDVHPHVDEALARAAAMHIDVAFSDPCFEVWPLLHLDDYGAQDGRHAVQRRLANVMPAYDHARNPVVDFRQISELFPTAYERASRHLDARSNEGNPLGCPCTTVGQLVLKIRDNGKGAFARR